MEAAENTADLTPLWHCVLRLVLSPYTCRIPKFSTLKSCYGLSRKVHLLEAWSPVCQHLQEEVGGKLTGNGGTARGRD